MIVRVERVAGVATVQDGGRPGRMHQGVPPGGALAPELLAAANLAVGNPPAAAALELVGRVALAAAAPLVAASEDALLELGPAAVEIAPRRRVGYVAFPGGIEVPPALGGRGTLLVARAGGLEGRPLRAGDRLAVGAAARAAIAPVPPRWDDGPIRVLLGPDPGDVAALLGGRYVVSPLGDRVGQRLTGPAVAAPALDASAPLVRGAVQATPGGELLVMGPDHPTTGGYPVVAVVVVEDHGRLASFAPGAEVRFVTR
jgi:allophanate hydrolase subunit 2